MKRLPRVVLLLENSRAYGRQLLRGIARYSRIHGPWAFYARGLFYRMNSTAENVLSRIRKWRPDGIIARDSEPVKHIQQLDIPLIVASAVDDTLKDLHRIMTNDTAIGAMAADHLCKRGFKNFAYCGYPDMFWSENRGLSFRAALVQQGFAVAIYEPPSNQQAWNWEQEQSYLAKWLKSLPLPVAIMACNDDRAQQVAEACIIAGYRVPYDVAIVGVDDDDQVCDLANPSLSSVKLGVEQAGFTAAKLLAQLMNSDKIAAPQVVIVDPIDVVRRESTDFLAVEDELVCKGLKFIRSHSLQPLQVHDIVQALGVSRRSLHERFRQTLGRTVHDEIKRARIDIIADMLVNSDVSITQIAKKLGYSSSDHLSRYFKKEMGRTPREFRNLHIYK
ncbi:MAG: DNA-binding transcriptional regulator [Sedimentisphaerales bacterium]|nr:DNA-binding transcriptional regulator [Sedimentisphaerales bacterium]